MAIGLIHFDANEFPAETQPCLRCGVPVPLVFAGPCEDCAASLRASMGGEAREVDGGEYVPKMNVTPNAVALKDD
ncbi:MAG: hypothetical protein JWL83_2987 [Actinomycetia bacterium]|nr:hypothetical protein [Actinomycetes bacterium]